MNSTLTRVYTFILDLLFPITCQGCGAEGEYLCLACQGELMARLPRCLVCGKNSPMGQVHSQCQNRDTHLHGLLVAASYHKEAVRKLIWNLKYNAVAGIADKLAELLADHLAELDVLDYFAAAALVPVPLHKRRLRHRSYNQAALIAEALARRLNLEYLPVLRKVKKTKSQIDLPREERLLNVKDSFDCEPHPSLRGRKIILIDDVATTGATLNECARELKKQNASEIWGLVVARN